VLILNEFAVDSEAAVVVEVEGVEVAVGGRLRSGRAGRWWVVGVSGWRRLSEWGCWDGIRSFGLGKWRVGSDEWRVVRGRSRFLAWLGMTIQRRIGGR